MAAAPTKSISVSFDAEVTTVAEVALVRLPPAASQKLPSRGQVAVRATLDGHRFDTVVEPDGRRGHWIRCGTRTLKNAKAAVGDVVAVELEIVDDWPEPSVPTDLAEALAAAPDTIRDIWSDITPMARWEWVRWVGATKNPDTRRRRVEVSLDKIDHGQRRPCCFDRSSCTDPDVASGGKLPAEGG